MNLNCVYAICILLLLSEISTCKYQLVQVHTFTSRPWAPLRRLYLISGSVSDLPIAALIAGPPSQSVQHNAEKMQPRRTSNAEIKHR